MKKPYPVHIKGPGALAGAEFAEEMESFFPNVF